MKNKKFDILPGGIIETGGNSVKNKTGQWSLHHAFIDQKKCIKCHLCAGHCPEGCVEIFSDGRNVEVNADYCKGCLVCAVECPAKAIKII